MKSMTVICKIKMTLNRGFEHDEELRLMREEKSHKLHLIRCASIPNLVQMKSTTVNCVTEKDDEQRT
jgi:hypothetical protein